MSVSPAASTVVAGSAAPAYSFVITPINGFNGAVTVTAAVPAGMVCAPVSCIVSMGSGTDSDALTVTPGASFAAGSQTLVFTAVSGALSHTASAALTVTAAPGSPVTPPSSGPPSSSPPVVAPNAPPLANCATPSDPAPPAIHQTGFVYTGDPSPTGIVYDAAHNQIFETNLQLNEVEVISPETMLIVERLPIPQPVGIDLSLDGKTLVIGTKTHYFYQASTSPVCVTGRVYMPAVSVLRPNLTPQLPTILADGSILFMEVAAGSELYRWSAAKGFVEPPGLGSLEEEVGNVVPSGDRRHVVLASNLEDGEFGRFDLDTGTVVTMMGAFGPYPYVYAVNQDGSRVLISSDLGLTIADGDFNLLTGKPISVETILAEPDFSRFYVKGLANRFITALDANLNPTGSLPAAFVAPMNHFEELRAFDGSHRLLTVARNGLSLLDTSKTGAALADGAPTPDIRIGVDYNAAFVPATPESGYATTLNGGGFATPSSVVFSEGTSSQPATGVTTTSTNVIDLTAPAFSSGCADVTVSFPGDLLAFASQAYCYGPTVYFVDGDAGPAAGGGVLTIYGQGFGDAPTVTIGGAAGSNVTVKEEYLYGAPFELSMLKVTAPAGGVGSADVVIQTSFGSTVLSKAYTYAQRVDAALPAASQPVQLIVDPARDRTLVIDAAQNNLLVYNTTSGALLQSIATGANPKGVALTPDGTEVLVLTAGDNTVSVLDASSYALVQKAVVPIASGHASPVESIATLAGGKALVVTEAGKPIGTAGPYSNAALFDYNMVANTVTLDPASLSLVSLSPWSLAASADGSTALVAERVFHDFGGPALQWIPSQFGDSDVALSADGQTNAIGPYMMDSSNREQNLLTAPTTDNAFNALDQELLLSGRQINASGSLLYSPTPDHLRIYDAQRGILVRTLEVPDGITGSIATHLLALDPAGQRVVLATASGISTFTFAADPLAIGEVTLSGSTLTVLGSGFTSATTLAVDTVAVPLSAQGVTYTTTRLSAAVSGLAAGNHSVTVTNADGKQITKYLAFATP